MEINGYTLHNEEKLNRAMFGSPIGEHGEMKGGVGDDAAPERIIAEYDRLAGYISKGGNKVKLGSFYDFKKRAPRATPEVEYEFRGLDGSLIYVPEGEALPMAVRAAQLAEDQKKVKRSKKKVDDDE